MVIDADVHISPRKEGLSITVDEVIPMLDGNGVDKALCWLKPPYLRYIDEANRVVYEATRRYPDRVIGFGWVNPRLGVDAACDAVQRCVHEYGFAGVKLNGAQDDYRIDDPQLSWPVIERIAEAGVALAFHVGADAIEHTHPFRVAKIAQAFPELTIFMVHMGGVGVPSLHDAAIEFAAQHGNLYLIGSATQHRAVLTALHTLGAERVCFGSDAPFRLQHVELAAYNALLRDRSAEERALVMGGTLHQVLFGER